MRKSLRNENSCVSLTQSNKQTKTILHMSNYAQTPEDLGRKNGFETAIAALRAAREEATEQYVYHNAKAVDARDAIESGNLKGDTLYKHHAERRNYFWYKSESLLDAINEMKKFGDNA